MKRTVLIVLTIIMSAAALASASVDQEFQVQGILTDNAGVALPDDEYLITFKLYDAVTGGLLMWDDTLDVIQSAGKFSITLSSLYKNTFDRANWLEMTREGEPPMSPRIRIMPVPVALHASTVDPTNAVTAVNAQKGDVTLVGGTNVTIFPTGTNELTINATTGVGGDDGDWLITGNDVSHALGSVWVGSDPAKAELVEPERGAENTTLDPTSAKMTVTGFNEGLVATLFSDNTLFDGRSAIFGRRSRAAANPGTGFSLNESNTAIKGYNVWGDSYTFGVAGHTWHDANNTGGILAADYYGNYWAALSFRDSSATTWGMYTPFNAHVGGLTDTGTLRVASGAAAGYILTSDADGVAYWSAPGAAQADSDWTIVGNNMHHAVIGATAIGTSAPHTWGDSPTATTMQISASLSPTLALDSQGGFPNFDLNRWTLTAGAGGMNFNHSTDFASFGTTAMFMDDGVVEVNRFDGATGIRLQGEGSLESGSRLDIYSTSTNTTLPTASLDGQSSSNDFGGSLTLRNGYGDNEVVITANYNNTGVGRVTTPVLEITGGADLSEQFDIGNTSALTEPGMVVSIDPDNPGRLTLSGQAYDRRVAGVISGAGGVKTGMLMSQRGTVADGELPVALIGRVYVWADASGGPIEPGDLLTTSDRPGHAMKVTDHSLATGAILGKAMSGLKEGQGLILTLVTLQ